MLDPQFLDFMPYTLTIQPVTGLSTDGYGARKFGTSYSWQCRIEQDSKLYVTKDGREARCNAILYGPPYDASTGRTTIVINQTDQITMPTGLLIAGSSRPPIVNVSQHADDRGTMYFEVIL